jgi:hypothetical protein
MSEGPDADTPSEPEPQKGRTRPGKVLPTNRIAFSKQLDILRAYANAAQASSGRGVTNPLLAQALDMHPSTVSLANPFFLDIGLLKKGEGGGNVASEEVIKFNRTYEWNPDRAGLELAPILAASWFWQSLLPILQMRSITERDAVERLAHAASVGREYESQLRVLLEYVVVSGLAMRDGNMLKVNKPERSVASAPPAPSDLSQPQAPTVTTTTVAPVAGMPGGAVRFHVEVNVDMKELAGWPADRITAFFSGIAQVLAAKGAAERQSSGGGDA